MQSFVNTMITAKGQPEPEIGMPATVAMFSDRYPATIASITRFKTGERKGQIKSVGVTLDKWRVVAGSMHDGSAKYMYESQPGTPESTFTLNKAGRFVAKSGDSLHIGTREKYENPSF